MRLNYYRFPAESDPMDRFNEGCAVILKTGSEIYPESIPDDKWPLIDHIDDVIGGITVTAAKKLLRKYGGSAWTEHIDRDGGCFEITAIHLTGNNSRFSTTIICNADWRKLCLKQEAHTDISE